MCPFQLPHTGPNSAGSRCAREGRRGNGGNGKRSTVGLHSRGPQQPRRPGRPGRRCPAPCPTSCSNLSHGNGMCRSMKKTSMAALLTSHRKQLPPEQPFHNSRWSNGERSSFHTDNGAPILHYLRSNILRLCQTQASLPRSLRCFTRNELLSIFPKSNV